MKIFKKKKYYYLFEYNGNPEIVKGDSMQESIDKIMWLWFLGGSKAKVVFKTSNDPYSLSGDFELQHNRSFLNGMVKAVKI